MNSASNYPDDIRKYDNDPRSPFFDDGGYDVWVDDRMGELLEDMSELDDIEEDVIAEIVLDEYSKKENNVKQALDNYFEELAEAQANREWKEKTAEPDYDEDAYEDRRRFGR